MSEKCGTGAQRGSGISISILEDTQSLSGQGPGALALIVPGLGERLD